MEGVRAALASKENDWKVAPCSALERHNVNHYGCTTCKPQPHFTWSCVSCKIAVPEVVSDHLLDDPNMLLECFLSKRSCARARPSRSRMPQSQCCSLTWGQTSSWGQ